MDASRSHWQGSCSFCAAMNCSHSRKWNREMHFFRFPKDPTRSKVWVNNVRREDLQDKSPEYLYTNCVVCQDHFEDIMFMNVQEKKRLVHNAVPTQINVGNPPPLLGSKRPAPKVRLEPLHKSRKLNQDQKPSATFVPGSGTSAPQLQSRETLEKELSRMKRKIHSLQMQVCRWKHRAKKQSAQVHKSKKSQALSELRTKLSEYLTPAQLQFVMQQVRTSRRSARGRRWTEKDKIFALSLLHSSPKTYKLLRKVFALPSITTLRQIVRKVDITPGFSTSILEALKLKAANLPPNDKLVSLVIDEMAIKEGVSYDKSNDMVEGFAHTTERSEELANHALVFMVRGLLTKWKLPIGYFMSSGTMKATKMKELLLQAVDKLQDIGLTVIVIVSDQGSNNVSLFEKQLGVTVKQPFFHHHESKIFFMYDPPHLVKSIRNNLKNHGFTIDGKDILWRHVQDFFDQDSSKPVRLAPRLTRKHLDLPPFAPLRVRLATQVLSHSVAAGMEVMAQWQIITEDAKYTAAFIEHMDQLFNSFNSNSLSSTAAMRHAVTESSGHVDFLKNTLNWFKTIKTKGSREPACLRGWQITITSLLLIWEELRGSYGVTFLLTNRFNQDCVENLFALIRAKGAQRDNPDAREFRAALRQVMVDGVMVPIKKGSCQEDIDRFLVNLAGKAVPPPQLESPVSRQEAMINSLPPNVRQLLQVCNYGIIAVDDPIGHQELNVLAYIGGYIVKKLEGHMCSSCWSKLSCQISKEEATHDFLVLKNYESAKRGLMAPSKCLQDVLLGIESDYRQAIEHCMSKEGVMNMLIESVEKNVDLQPILCAECYIEKAVVHLMLTIRLHHSLKETNRRLQQAKRRNRKTLKCSHL